MGLLIWQDGILDSNDDIETVRVQNLAYDNYLYSAYEAFAARVLADYDPVFADCLAGIAREDYEFASQQREHDNFGGWINPYEHTYSTGESLYMATASWAASMLYELTADPQYAADASAFADYVLRCQQAIPVGGLVGFFYRNPQRHSVVHSIHQSREQIFMLAMDALCRTQPDNPGRDRWETSIALYGSYLRNLMRYTAPYGMIPTGIYRSDEPDDAAAFFALHIFPPDDARERFAAQAESGVSVAPVYFVRRFPVWFNIFNGNLAVHTSMGKAAAICARRFGDPELLDIAREQMYWTVGKNPSPRTNPDIEVLVSLSPKNYPFGIKDVISGGDFPVVWRNRNYRMVYINYGHGDREFLDATQNLLTVNVSVMSFLSAPTEIPS